MTDDLQDPETTRDDVTDWQHRAPEGATGVPSGADVLFDDEPARREPAQDVPLDDPPGELDAPLEWRPADDHDHVAWYTRA